MSKETYERLNMIVTVFDAEDVIATSDPGSGDPGNPSRPTLKTGNNEMGINIPIGF